MKHLHNLLISMILTTGTVVHAQTKEATTTPAPAAPSTANRGSDKLDLKKLEEKYWAAKDDEYGVIQNRTFAKSKRFYLTLNYGTLINDPYVSSKSVGGLLGYFFSENFGVEFSYLNYMSKRNDTVDYLKNRSSQIVPNYNMISSNMALSMTYTPFYAKMAFMNKAILYFDMGFTLGAGLTGYKQVQGSATTPDVYTDKSTPHVELGFMQQMFINKNWAFRLDIKNTYNKQKVIPYQINSNTNSGEESVNANDTTLTLGATFFIN